MVLVAAGLAVGAFVGIGTAAAEDGDRATVGAAFGAAVFALWIALRAALVAVA